MKQKQYLGADAAVQGNAAHECEANSASSAAFSPMSKCRRGRLAWVRFPERCSAVLHALFLSAAVRAVLAFFGAATFVRHSGRMYNDLIRYAVAHEALQYVRLSAASKKMKAEEVAILLALIDVLCREKYGR